ncbi:PAS domain-containing protein [Celeribacter litoreus]|uniref:PAS domain-containing protein n=1 Tax=Celeribacter litoreus TaxID=2876714 RepID=UPI001CCA8E76|nr:PAS domain-containing protein [Celeribacter litoreus]MCA0042163.1 hypothetical protein [Celeribacter litoreus]
MSLTRRFRSEIEVGQAVLDTLDEAVAVFSSDGSLTMVNAAYSKLWGHEPFGSLSDCNIGDTTEVWHAKSAPTHLWSQLRDFLGCHGDRNELTGTTHLWDGRRLNCRFTPLPAGHTLVGFSPEGESALQRLNAPMLKEVKHLKM